MASITLYHAPADNAINVGSPVVITAATPDHITAEGLYERDEYYGAFTYDAFGNVSGSVTSIGVYTRNASTEPWQAWASLTGRTWDARTIQIYVQTADPALYDYLLSDSDTLVGSAEADFFGLGPGDDSASGGAGDDAFLGDAGNDTLDGGPGNDTLQGGLGNDTYVVDSINDLVNEFGNEGFDTIQSYVNWALTDTTENLTLLGAAVTGIGNYFTNVIVGNSAANILTGLGDADLITGGGGNDWIEGEAGNNPLPMGQVAGADNLSGGDGNDTILAGGGDDLVHGDAGDDTIVGEAGVDVIYGGDGQDALDGRAGIDVIYGEVGVDIIFGDADSDTLYGGDQGDVIMGERGEDSPVGAHDVLYGEAGNDLLDGSAGDDTIYGGEGFDQIHGDYGSDYIVAGPGADYMVGSAASPFAPETAGQDLFVYQSLADAGDEIWGFDTRVGTNDGIDLRPLFDALGYSGTTPRADGWMTVTTGAVPTDSMVWIDPNGGGNGFVVPLLTLHGVAPATLTDSFFVFQ